MSFLANVIPAVFSEADPSIEPTITHGAGDMGVDLTFSTAPSGRLALIQIKGPRVRAGIPQAIEQIRKYLSSAGDGRVSAAYVIAGRKETLEPRLLEPFQGAEQDIVPIRILSWDDVVDRISAEAEDDQEDSYNVILVEIVQMSRRLLRKLVSVPELLSGIDDRKFEELVATLLYDIGFQDVHLTPPRKDGGRDIEVTYVDRPTNRRLRLFIECKHWVSGKKVTARWAISLLNVSKNNDAASAILLSSSGFGPRLIEQEAAFSRQGLFLKDQRDLGNWIQVWERQYGSLLLEPVDPRDILELNPEPEN
jgi:hypothetical protein